MESCKVREGGSEGMAETAPDAKAHAELDRKLTEAEVKALVVEEQMSLPAALDSAIHGEMDRVSQQLTQRVKELAGEVWNADAADGEPRGGAGGQGKRPSGENGFLMEMKTGYKQTEIGVIPEDWECGTVDRLVQVGLLEKPLDGNHGNIHPKSGDFVDFGIPFVMANNVQMESLIWKTALSSRKVRLTVDKRFRPFR